MARPRRAIGERSTAIGLDVSNIVLVRSPGVNDVRAAIKVVFRRIALGGLDVPAAPEVNVSPDAAASATVFRLRRLGALRQ